LTDKQLLSYYQSCQAVIFPQEEDFGLVPLEAQACGKPVIAFGKAGALETIIENKTGLFFNQQTVESLIEKLVTFKEKNFSSEDCRNQALRFSKQNFIKEFKKKVEEKWQKK
jgi:glycosyltransferase involved in cell wall biosynthesis